MAINTMGVLISLLLVCNGTLAGEIPVQVMSQTSDSIVIMTPLRPIYSPVRVYFTLHKPSMEFDKIVPSKGLVTKFMSDGKTMILLIPIKNEKGNQVSAWVKFETVEVKVVYETLQVKPQTPK